MNGPLFNFTGRILKWFTADIRIITPSLRAQPNGLWSYPEPGVGRPLYWRLPHPLHPLETIASMRGMGVLEEEGKPDLWFGLGMSATVATRQAGWFGLTAHIAKHLFVPPGTVRLLWHALTPLNVPYEYDGVVRQIAHYLYKDAGFDGPPFERPVNGPFRPTFWTEEIGEVEL